MWEPEIKILLHKHSNQYIHVILFKQINQVNNNNDQNIK
jgi:hypothetical protein